MLKGHVRIRRFAISPLCLLLSTLACSAPDPAGSDGGTDVDAGVDAGPAGVDAGVHIVSMAVRNCARAPAPVKTIGEVVQRLNALPHPAGVACLVASLKRPLDLVATTSTFSAQPAGSAKSPRLFLLSPELVVSVVGDGPGAKLLELGEYVTPTRTVKGELELPVTAPLAADAALIKVEQSNSTTTCGVCHRNEEKHPTIPHAYSSVAFRPNPGQEVPLATVVAEHQRCIDTAEMSDRCDLYHALFDFGPVRQGAFSTQLALFF
jgi:hypothetical protein